MELPGRQGAVLAGARLQVDHARGAEVGPGELLLAGPGHLHRLARRPGQAGRLDGRLAGMLAAVARAGVGHDHPDAVLGHAERLGQLAADPERPLRPGPDGRCPVVPLRHGGARLQRGMRDVGDRERHVDLHVRRGQPVLDRAGPPSGRAGGLLDRLGTLPEVGGQVAVGRMRGRLPLGADRGQGLRGGGLVGGRDADEVAVMDDRHAGHGLGLRRVDRDQLGVEGRRPQDLPAQHPGALDVGGVLVPAGHERAAVDLRDRAAGDLPAVGRGDGDILVDDLDELPALRQLAEAERATRRGMRDLPLGHDDGGAVDLPLFGGQPDEQRRAAAAALRSCGAIVGVVRLPKVPRSKGTRAVSPMTMRTDSGGRWSSSATAWASDVRMSCPTSTLPV